jgi:hypothetical protein
MSKYIVTDEWEQDSKEAGAGPKISPRSTKSFNNLREAEQFVAKHVAPDEPDWTIMSGRDRSWYDGETTWYITERR